MEHPPTTESATAESLQPTQVWLMAAICLAMGLGIGYVSRGLQASSSPAVSAASAPLNPPGSPTRNPHVPTLEQMKQAADKQAEPLLTRLKANPGDTSLLLQLGAMYHGSHQFKEAAEYYGKASQTDPRNVAIRTRLASSLYRSGDVDGAIAQLNEGLKYAPTDANSLFNLGMIRLQGKGDGKGAVAAWQKLLKSNPQLSTERKAEVQKLMADVMTTTADPQARKGAAAK